MARRKSRKTSRKGGRRYYGRRRHGGGKPKRLSAEQVLIVGKLAQGEFAAADRVISKVEAATGYGLDALLLGNTALIVIGHFSPQVRRAHAAVLGKVGLRP